MRIGRPVEAGAARSAPDPFFVGRLAIVDVRSEVREDRPIAFLCPSGHRSALAARGAVKRRPDVAGIDGGMDAWIAAELPTAHCRPPHTDRRTA